jgi:hypothetical protein
MHMQQYSNMTCYPWSKGENIQIMEWVENNTTIRASMRTIFLIRSSLDYYVSIVNTVYIVYIRIVNILILTP